MSIDLANRLGLTLREAAEVSGLSRDTLSKAIHAGDLAAKHSAKDEKGRRKTGGKTVIRPADLAAWLDGLADA